MALQHKMIIKIHCPHRFPVCQIWRVSTIKQAWNWAGGPEKDPEDQVRPLWSYTEQRTRSLSAEVMLNKLSWMHLRRCSKAEDLKGPIFCLCWVLLGKLIFFVVVVFVLMREKCWCCCADPEGTWFLLLIGMQCQLRSIAKTKLSLAVDVDKRRSQTRAQRQRQLPSSFVFGGLAEVQQI